MGSVRKGLIAGAVGTELLNITTYLDMAVRGRGTSSVPDDDVQKMVDRAGISLGQDEDTAANRRTAIGTLLGYLTGASMGVSYGLARPVLRHLPGVPAAVLVGMAAMAATDAASTAMGTTDPRSWSAQDWLADSFRISPSAREWSRPTTRWSARCRTRAGRSARDDRSRAFSRSG